MVALTKTGQYIVTPDNGTLSYIKKDVGIVAVREISEVENRCSNTELSYKMCIRDSDRSSSSVFRTDYVRRMRCFN